MAAGLRTLPWPVWLIFVLCLLPELVLSGTDLGLWGQTRDRTLAIDYFGFWAGLLHGWTPNYSVQPYAMFLSYGFLHAGLVHFGLNMATLFSLGPPVERVAGGWRFLACYLILLVAGGLGFALVPAALAAPMIGASGALFGLAGMILAWDYQIRARRRIPILPVLRSVAMLVVLNGLLWLAMGGRLAWQTHLGGFVGGWLLALWVRPR
ncbi:MAG: rhomboid family intramembrane serine protease [Proteobacteria bacterium]|nr:rhomboid family intramembrane serine protease [Pseudomonadota bacterium]